MMHAMLYALLRSSTAAAAAPCGGVVRGTDFGCSTGDCDVGLAWTSGLGGVAECCDCCREHPGCKAWSWSTVATNKTKHPCWLKSTATAISKSANSERVSGFAAADPPPPPPPPLHGCLPPHDTAPWCDATLPAARRAELLASVLTVPELVTMMQGDTPAIDRLGVPLYHYGCEEPSKKTKNSRDDVAESEWSGFQGSYSFSQQAAEMFSIN